MRWVGVQIKPMVGRPRNGAHSLLMTLILFVEYEIEIGKNFHSTKKIPLLRMTRWNDNGMRSIWLSAHFLVSISYLLSNFLHLQQTKIFWFSNIWPSVKLLPLLFSNGIFTKLSEILIIMLGIFYLFQVESVSPILCLNVPHSVKKVSISQCLSIRYET